MATFSSVKQTHVLQAIAEHDARGAAEFLDVHGFTPTPAYTLVHEGRGYDAKALLAVAHRHATGRLATPDEFRSSLPEAVAILRRRGFQVTEPTTASRPAARTARTPRAPRTPARRSTPPPDERAAVCPTCSMTLPATGVCDTCD